MNDERWMIKRNECFNKEKEESDWMTKRLWEMDKAQIIQNQRGIRTWRWSALEAIGRTRDRLSVGFSTASKSSWRFGGKIGRRTSTSPSAKDPFDIESRNSERRRQSRSRKFKRKKRGRLVGCRRVILSSSSITTALWATLLGSFLSWLAGVPVSTIQTDKTSHGTATTREWRKFKGRLNRRLASKS